MNGGRVIFAAKGTSCVTTNTFRTVLKRSGYTEECLRVPAPAAMSDLGRSIPNLIAYCRRPHDVRTAAIAFGESPSPDASLGIVKEYQETGAPVVILAVQENIEVWRQGVCDPELNVSIPANQLEPFFAEWKESLSPDAVYRTKNFKKPSDPHQMEFVDIGLMPFVERNVGKKLSDMLSRVVRSMVDDWEEVQGATDQDLGLLLRSVFRLLVGKVLVDKGVDNFKRLNVSDPADVLARVAKHYGGSMGDDALCPKALALLTSAGEQIFEMSSLCDMSTESLGVIYENTFISKATRKKLGTHSTPPWLADYMMWQVEDWFKAIPAEERFVYEPACGHGAFLVAALRMLQQFAFEEGRPYTDTALYLRKMLYGVDIDPFSLEIARLSLSLTDIPRPNGWKLGNWNLFETDPFKKGYPKPALVLTNPPYEEFTEAERAKWSCQNFVKHAEIVARALPHIRENGIVGFVAPRTLLTLKSISQLRKTLATTFEIREIDQFPDKVFRFSDAETCVLLARRKAPCPDARIQCGYVFEKGVPEFQNRHVFGFKQDVAARTVTGEPEYRLNMPLLNGIWDSLSHHPRLGSVAHVGRGIELHANAKVEAGETKKRYEVVNSVDSNILCHQSPTFYTTYIAESQIRRKGSAAVSKVPQIMVNAARVNRYAWPVRALLDQKGLTVSTNFYTVRPKSEKWPLEFFWALLNSPIGNAFVHSRSGKLHILKETLIDIPLPLVHDTQDIVSIVHAVKDYFTAAKDFDDLDVKGGADDMKLKRLRWQVDAEILKLYDLAPRDERMLLDLFTGHKRLGVAFDQNEFYPRDFVPCLPLHEYLSYIDNQNTAAKIRQQPVWKMVSPEFKQALSRAVELYPDGE
ncbi:MAG: N-6 DNA Methylase [Betaproteobacteria bacterium ADurb.Bin341]|nr:MAG: N-6 DNA Methylase [Betaproteobacteria bacterium ADurb.Bin341]